MMRRGLASTLAVLGLAVLALPSGRAAADTVVKIGLINSYTGFVAQAGDEGQKGIDLYVKEHEKDLPPGVKIQLIKRDDTSTPEVGKRLAQELIARDHVQLLTGVVLSPVAAAIAPLTAEAKVPLLLSIAAAGVQIPRISPYVARVTFTLWQQGYPIGKWAAEQGWKTGYTAVSDFIPGHDSEQSFTKGFTDGGGKIIGAVRMPPQNPDFVPFIQRIKDAKPDVAFFFVPADPQATALIKAIRDLGVRQAGINITAPQDILPDEALPHMGDTPLGLITAGTYSTAGKRPANEAFLAAWKKAYGDASTPDFLVGRRLGRDGGDLRPDQGDQRQVHRRRGDGVLQAMEEPGQPARPDQHRPGDARHHPEHLYPQGRKGRRQARQRRDRDDPQRQGSVEGTQSAEIVSSARPPDCFASLAMTATRAIAPRGGCDETIAQPSCGPYGACL